MTRIEHTNSVLRYISFLGGEDFHKILNNIGLYNIYGAMTNKVIRNVCRLVPAICSIGEGLFISSDPLIDDNERYQVYTGHIPAGASYKSGIHYSQMMKQKRFQLYDYGPHGNMEHYGDSSPP